MYCSFLTFFEANNYCYYCCPSPFHDPEPLKGHCFSEKSFPLSQTKAQAQGHRVAFFMGTLHLLPPILSQEAVGHSQDQSRLSLKRGVGTIHSHTHSQ